MAPSPVAPKPKRALAAVKLAIVAIFFSAPSLSSASGLFNPVDGCWMRDRRWARHRTRLANCAVGFGSYANGGKAGATYVVTRDDDDAVRPAVGTLRYGVTRTRPLWIVFARDMNIRLRVPLFVASHKTIDARGAAVHIGMGGPCLRLWNVSNVIIHGLHIHDCSPSSATNVIVSEHHGVEWASPDDGDAITVECSHDLWIDHNTLSHSKDGLIDVTLGSTAVTITNNRFFDHNEVMLFGNSETYEPDKLMKVTLAFNQFGPDLIQRIPRVREGYVHVANNNYEPWGIYAIGGSARPTILSEGNRFMAPKALFKKAVTEQAGCSLHSCDGWSWRSMNDWFLRGAYFKQSGIGVPFPAYDRRQRFPVYSAKWVPRLTKRAGALNCRVNRRCRSEKLSF